MKKDEQNNDVGTGVGGAGSPTHLCLGSSLTGRLPIAMAANEMG